MYAPHGCRIYIKETERAKNHGRTKLRLVFPLLAYKYTTDTKKREREGEGRKKKMYAGGRLTYFVADSLFNLDAGKEEEEAPAYIKTAIIYPN